MSAPLRVGFAGLGRMGAAMARNLAGAGLLAAVYNRTAAVAEEFARETGVQACATPAELASFANVLITMVADEQATIDLYTGEAGFLSAIRPGTVGIEMSTVSVDHVRSLAPLLEAKDCELLDVPVSGSVSMAESATLTLLAGGGEAAVDRIEPVLKAIGSPIFRLGPLGSGATVKLAVNTIVYALNEALAEALVLAERAGIQRERVYEVFASSAIAAPYVHYRREAFERPGEVPVTLRLRLAEKDLRLILDLAAQVGHSMPQAERNTDVLRQAMDAGFGDADISAVAEYLRKS